MLSVFTPYRCIAVEVAICYYAFINLSPVAAVLVLRVLELSGMSEIFYLYFYSERQIIQFEISFFRRKLLYRSVVLFSKTNGQFIAA